MRLLVAYVGGGLTLWDTTSRRRARKLAGHASSGAGARALAFSPSGADLAVAHATTPFVSVYPWTQGTGFGAKYANPATLPADAASSVAAIMALFTLCAAAFAASIV